MVTRQLYQPRTVAAHPSSSGAGALLVDRPPLSAVASECSFRGVAIVGVDSYRAGVLALSDRAT